MLRYAPSVLLQLGLLNLQDDTHKVGEQTALFIKSEEENYQDTNTQPTHSRNISVCFEVDVANKPRKTKPSLFFSSKEKKAEEENRLAKSLAEAIISQDEKIEHRNVKTEYDKIVDCWQTYHDEEDNKSTEQKPVVQRSELNKLIN